jgi:hypothetical protein
MSEREPEADRHRTLALRHQLAGGVVDRGNVIGVECMPHAKGVGGEAQPDAQHLGRADLVVLRRHDSDEYAPADYVEQQDTARHTDDRAPLLPAESAAKSRGHPPDSCDTWC